MINRSGKNKWQRVPFLGLILAFPLFWMMMPRPAPAVAATAGRMEAIPALQSSPTQASPVGDAERGRELFMGILHFQNGAPPCMGCHNVDSNGILGGGALGPDLTNVASLYSEADLAEVLVNPGPVMRPIFTDLPPTTEEQADLIAFLKASVGQKETNRETLVILISLGGLLAAAGLFGVIYRRRLRGVRKPLMVKTRPGK